MVELRHHQRLVWEGWFPEQAQGWWEGWMRQADQVLDDDELRSWKKTFTTQRTAVCSAMAREY